MSSSITPEQIDIQFAVGDYVGNITPYAKIQKNAPLEASGHAGETQRGL